MLACVRAMLQSVLSVGQQLEIEILKFFDIQFGRLLGNALCYVKTISDMDIVLIEWMDGCYMDRWMDMMVCHHIVWVDKYIDGWIDRWADGWMDKRTSGWVD